MHPPRFAAALVLLLGSAVGARAAEIEPLLPPDTETFLSVNVRQILDSAVFKKGLLARLKAELEQAGDGHLKDALRDLGIDPFKDIDRLVVAAPGGKETDRGLIIARGTFDTAKFKSKGDDAIRQHPDGVKLHKVPLGAGKTHEVYEVVIPQQDLSLFVCLVDNKLLVASPGKDYVVDALKNARDKKTPALKSKDFQNLLEKLDPKQSISVALLGKALNNGNFGDLPQILTDTFGSIEAIGGGLTVTDDLRLEVLLASKTTDGAKKTQQALDKGVKMALVGLGLLADDRKELSLLMEIVKSIKVSNKGKVVGVTGKLTQDVLDDFFKKDG